MICFAALPETLRPRDTRRPPRGGRRGYSLIEMLLTMLLIQFIGGLVAAEVSNAATAERVNYAGQETLSALRYARQLAQSTGAPCGVIFDDANQKISVFKGSQCVIAPNSALTGGQYVIYLSTQANLAGTTLSRITLAGGGKVVIYGQIGATSNLPRGLGSTTTNGTVTLGFGAATCTVLIPDVGEPTLQ